MTDEDPDRDGWRERLEGHDEPQAVLAYINRVEARRLVRMADVRPSYAETLPAIDRLGRSEGHWLGGLTYAVGMGQWGVGYKEVPSNFWSLSVTNEGYPLAEVACQCDADVACEALAPMVRCECGRWFLFDGANVFCFYESDPSKTRELVAASTAVD
jgi:hypothetical protein